VRPLRAVPFVLALVIVVAWLLTAGAGAEPAGERGAYVVVLAGDSSDLAGPNEAGGTDGSSDTDPLLRHFAGTDFSLGLVSTAQGRYDQYQAMLDVSSGTRQPRSLYASDAPGLTLQGPSSPLSGDQEAAGRWRIAQWGQVRDRAGAVSSTIRPGLLAESIGAPGAAFVGLDREPTSAASIAADLEGNIGDVWFGPPADLVDRLVEARRRHRLVVVQLPGDEGSLAAVDALVANRAGGDLVVVVQLPSTNAAIPTDASPQRHLNQTVIAVAGEGPPRSLTSGSTRQPGLVTAIDIAPTVLAHMGVEVPARMRGQQILSRGPIDVAGLESARRRWGDVRSGRQAGSVQAIGVLAAALFLILAGAQDPRRAGRRAGRILGLAMLWWPFVALGAGAIALRSAAAEVGVIATAAMVLATGTDQILRWPRGPILPAAGGLGLLSLDLAFGGRLLTRSILGPSVVSGNRFYGISNEIEPILPILVLVALAASGGLRSRLRTTYAVAGVLLAGLVGSGRLGADVGGVITVSAAMVVAILVVTKGRPSRRSIALGLATPVAALLVLLAIDWAGGQRGHLLDNVTRATGPGELWELVARRYQLAGRIVLDPANAAALAVCALVVAGAVRYRSTLYGTLPHRGWDAALLGGLAGGVAGALSNDSGPVLAINAVIALAGVTAYLVAPPGTGHQPQPINHPLPGEAALR